MSMSDKVAVVCGSTSGIGKATAILLAQRGCKLILLSRNEDKLKKTIDELTKISNVNHPRSIYNSHNQVCYIFKISTIDRKHDF